MGCMCACVRCASSGFAAAQRHVCGATSLRPSPFTHGPCRFVTSMSWPLKTLPPSILRLHAPRRAPSSPESSPWSAAEHPGRQRLLGACLAGFFAGALLTLLCRTQRRVESEQVCPPSHARHSNHSHARVARAQGCRRCGSGGRRRGGATHAAVDQRERALIRSAADP